MYDMHVNGSIFSFYNCKLTPTYYLGNSIYVCKYSLGKMYVTHSNLMESILLYQGFERFGYIVNKHWRYYDDRLNIELCLDPIYYNDKLDKYITPFSKLFKRSAIIILDNKDWVNNREFKAWIDAMNSSDAEIRRSAFPLVFKQSNRVPVNKFVKDVNSQ